MVGYTLHSFWVRHLLPASIKLAECLLEIYYIFLAPVFLSELMIFEIFGKSIA